MQRGTAGGGAGGGGMPARGSPNALSAALSCETARLLRAKPPRREPAQLRCELRAPIEAAQREPRRSRQRARGRGAGVRMISCHYFS